MSRHRQIANKVNILKIKKKKIKSKKRVFKKPFKRRLGISRGEVRFNNFRRTQFRTNFFNRNVQGKSSLGFL